MPAHILLTTSTASLSQPLKWCCNFGKILHKETRDVNTRQNLNFCGGHLNLLEYSKPTLLVFSGSVDTTVRQYDPGNAHFLNRLLFCGLISAPLAVGIGTLLLASESALL